MNSNNDKKLVYKILFISEAFIFVIALAIISIFAIVLIIYFPADEEVAQGIFTAFMAWIGAIIGFYFGQKPVRDVITRLEEKSEEALKIRTLLN
jgi:ABC-type antimicrobial peptide transport system permease subunit